MLSSAGVDVQDFVSASQVSGWDLVLAAIAILAGWIVGRIAHRAVLGVLGRVSGVSENLRQFTARLAKYLVVMLGVGVALSFLGAEIQPLITAAIIVAVVAALALRGVAENFASGVVLQTRRPITLGDEIEAMGFVGVVTEMNGRSVVIETYDGKTVHLPNSQVLEGPVVNNFERHARRTDVEVRAERSDDIEATVAAIRTAVAGAAGVRSDPPPTVALTSAEPHRIAVLVRVWGEPGSELTTGSSVVHDVAEALRKLGIDATVTTPPPPPPFTPPPVI